MDRPNRRRSRHSYDTDAVSRFAQTPPVFSTGAVGGSGKLAKIAADRCAQPRDDETAHSRRNLTIKITTPRNDVGGLNVICPRRARTKRL